MLTVTLPWPSRALSPNAGGKLRHKIRAKMDYREDAFWLTKEALQEQGPLRWAGADTRLPVSLTFCPPTKGRRDTDNFVASCKHGLDGIARALQMDDSLFRLLEPQWGDVRKGGAVIVRLG